MSPCKSGSSNLSQVFCHSKINLAIKECLLLSIKIQQNKWLGLSPSSFHAGYCWPSPQVPCAHQEWWWHKACDAAGIQTGTGEGLRHRNCPSPFPCARFCSAAPSSAQLPVPTDSLGDELPKSTTEKIQTANCWAWSWLSAQPLCSLPRLVNHKQTGFRHRPREMQDTTGPQSVSAPPSTAHSHSRWQRTDRTPCARNSLQGKPKSLKQFSYIEVTSTAHTAWSKLSLLFTCVV